MRGSGLIPLVRLNVHQLAQRCDGKQPRSQIGALAPEVTLGERAGDAFLDQVARVREITDQRPRVASKDWNLGFDLVMGGSAR